MLSIFSIFPLYYNGLTKFTPVHASDVADLIYNIISKGVISKYRGIGPVLTLKEIIEILLNYLKKEY